MKSRSRDSLETLFWNVSVSVSRKSGKVSVSSRNKNRRSRSRASASRFIAYFQWQLFSKPITTNTLSVGLYSTARCSHSLCLYAIDPLHSRIVKHLCYLVVTYHLRNNVNMTESETSYSLVQVIATLNIVSTTCNEVLQQQQQLYYSPCQQLTQATNDCNI